MQKDADTFISNNDKAFILQALTEEQRIDGRQPYDIRTQKIAVSADGSGVSLQLGGTRVLAVVGAKLETPKGRPREGSINFKVDFSPMASPAFESGRPSEGAQLMSRLLQKAIRNTSMIDLEALCVSAGRKVWALVVQVTVMDNAGNLTDACLSAVVAALLAFRRPDVTVDASTSAVTVHSPDVREPLPLSVHHTPLSVTFALFGDGDKIVVDPSLKEEAACAGQVTVVVNTHEQVCCIQQLGGLGLTLSQIMRLVRIAASKVPDVMASIKSALETHTTSQLASRVRRQRTSKGTGMAFIDVNLPPTPMETGVHDSSHVSTQAGIFDASGNEEQGWGTSMQLHRQQHRDELLHQVPLAYQQDGLPSAGVQANNAAAASHAGPVHPVQKDVGNLQGTPSQQAASASEELPTSPPSQGISRRRKADGEGRADDMSRTSARRTSQHMLEDTSEQPGPSHAETSFDAIAARIAGTSLSGDSGSRQGGIGKKATAAVGTSRGRSRKSASDW